MKTYSQAQYDKKEAAMMASIKKSRASQIADIEAAELGFGGVRLDLGRDVFRAASETIRDENFESFEEGVLTDELIDLTASCIKSTLDELHRGL